MLVCETLTPFYLLSDGEARTAVSVKFSLLQDWTFPSTLFPALGRRRKERT